MVSLLLQWKPALATHVDRNKSSPLHFASSDGDCSIVQAILACSPPSAPHMQDNEGFSPIHAAALMGHTATVRLLLQFSPASADICDNRGQSFVHTAATKGHSSIISYAIGSSMLEHLLNAQDREGNTPLHLAVDAGKCKIVSKLLSSEIVQAHIMNDEGHTPSDLVQNCKGFYSMVSLVVKMYASGAQFQPQRQDHIEKWNAQDIMKWRDTTSKYLAIVSTLVATVAFSTAFNIPGSYGDDGKANLAGNCMYDTFLILDTISLVTSVVAIMLLLNALSMAVNKHHGIRLLGSYICSDEQEEGLKHYNGHPDLFRDVDINDAAYKLNDSRVIYRHSEVPIRRSHGKTAASEEAHQPAVSLRDLLHFQHGFVLCHS
uniref:PGG domain-containing protein n=1 Tax=Oryza glaberrima TaxID=4538 RepID=I1QZS6_ORYGL